MTTYALFLRGMGRLREQQASRTEELKVDRMKVKIKKQDLESKSERENERNWMSRMTRMNRQMLG